MQLPSSHLLCSLSEVLGTAEAMEWGGLGICREVLAGAAACHLQFISLNLQSSAFTAGYEKCESSSLNVLKSASGKKPVCDCLGSPGGQGTLLGHEAS